MSNMRRVFIVVKTYPTISKTYDELVCTAGILDDGSWVRIYPLPFRKLDLEKRFAKYQWMAMPLSKNTADFRSESYKVDDISKIEAQEFVKTDGTWTERKRIICQNNPIHEDLTALIEQAKAGELSLAIFKPKSILDFHVEAVDREWSEDKLRELDEKAKQLSFFQTEAEVRKEFTAVPKLPFKFSYTFEDCADRTSKMMIEDWEIGRLYWNCLEQADGDEARAVELVRQKYLVEFSNKDIHLFLGTTKQFHNVGPNPFIIIGVFYPPRTDQGSLL